MRVGDKVVCIDDQWVIGKEVNFIDKIRIKLSNKPKKDEIYTVTDYSETHIMLIGFDWWYAKPMFRKLDHSFGERMAAEIEEEINEEQLILK